MGRFIWYLGKATQRFFGKVTQVAVGLDKFCNWALCSLCFKQISYFTENCYI